MPRVWASGSRTFLAAAIGLGACNGEAAAPASSGPPRSRSSAPAEATAPREPSGVGETKAGRAPEPARTEVAALLIDAPEGWSAQYSAALQSWTVQRDASASDATVAADRFYVDAFPPDAPTDVDAYAAALESDPQYQDAGYLFVAIDRKEAVEGGWVIAGTSKDTSDEESEGVPSFVLLRAALGVYCHSGTFVDAKSRDDAIRICQAIRPGGPSRKEPAAGARP